MGGGACAVRGEMAAAIGGGHVGGRGDVGGSGWEGLGARGGLGGLGCMGKLGGLEGVWGYGERWGEMGGLGMRARRHRPVGSTAEHRGLCALTAQ